MSDYPTSPPPNILSEDQPPPSQLRIPSNPNYSPSTPTSTSRPQLKWKNSGPSQHAHKRMVYSTDDDENEVEQDLEERDREYLEGYTDALKQRQDSVGKRFLRKTSLPTAAIKPILNEEEPTPDNEEIHYHPLHHLKHVDQTILESPKLRRLSDEEEQEEEEEEEQEENGEESQSIEEPDVNEEELAGEDDEDEVRSNASVETFTLRERQDAINTTHPFGIRIWKPALYKKIRSVQKIAEGDIHSIPGKKITLPVWIGNALWSIIFGILLLVICTIASSTLVLIFWSPAAQEYGKKLFSLGTYLLFPFGKFVELENDENYILEDEGEGRPLDEYERWQAGDVEFGRLFFGPRVPTINTTTTAAAVDNVTEGQAARDTPENRRLLSDYSDTSVSPRKRRLFGRGKWNIGRIIFYLWYYLVIAPLLYLISLICWLGVFSIPMGKVTSILASHLRRHPLAMSFKPASAYSSTSSSSSILLCTYRALGWNYVKYTIDGTNIFLINLMFAVFFVLFDYYVLFETLKIENAVTSPVVIFSLSLFSVIPLAYFIGQAVASISAQSSMGMGAAINAFFSTVVEVFLYSVALDQGKGDLVEGSIIGSILAGVLLMPGLSMCTGAIKRKTQRYNPRSAGVSSTMLIFAIIGAFAPTIFYQIYGTYELQCVPCKGSIDAAECKTCQFFQVPLRADRLYKTTIQPFSYICAILLFVSYCIGLWFTLRTHAAMIWSTPISSDLPTTPLLITQHQAPHEEGVPITVVPAAPGSVKKKNAKHVVINDVNIIRQLHEDAAATALQSADQSGGGHDAPNWSRAKSTVILLGATVLYAIIAEVLVDTVDVVLSSFPISPKLLGITVFALIPNTTEFLNAISFAVNGNIALSMEIGSAYALQVCLLQIPGLVLYSIWTESSVIKKGPIHDFMFTLVFPRWDLFMVVFCVFLFSYIYAEGKSNYFKGSILLLAYLVVMLGFYFSDLAAPFTQELVMVASKLDL